MESGCEAPQPPASANPELPAERQAAELRRHREIPTAQRSKNMPISQLRIKSGVIVVRRKNRAIA
jgi:hypothetical protein